MEYEAHDGCRSLEETYETLEELRKEGKFKYIGISEPSAETLRKAAKASQTLLARMISLFKSARNRSRKYLPCKLNIHLGPRILSEVSKVHRHSYAALERRHRPTDGVLSTARELGIPIIAYSPLGRGFLTVSEFMDLTKTCF